MNDAQLVIMKEEDGYSGYLIFMNTNYHSQDEMKAGGAIFTADSKFDAGEKANTYCILNHIPDYKFI